MAADVMFADMPWPLRSFGRKEPSLRDRDRGREMIERVEPLVPALRRYARLLLKDDSSIDDLVQDCLEKTWTNWHARRPDVALRPWLFAILHNLAIDRIRQSARRGRHVPIDEIDEAATVAPSNQDQALNGADLLKAMGRLPEEQRSVLILVAIEDLSYAETAKVLDVPIGTVMSRLSRARQQLQRAIDHPGQSVATGARR